MHDYLTRRRDFFAGGLMMLLGIGAAYAGSGYEVGSLQKMGPGFFPLALGIILALLGIVIAGSAAASGGEDDEHTIPVRAEWRGWLCIVAGPLLFVVLGHYGGLVPATFSCVFVSALGDRSATLRSSLTLAAGITLLGVVLFAYVLGVPFPALRWEAS
jgi:hypothetical protein